MPTRSTGYEFVVVGKYGHFRDGHVFHGGGVLSSKSHVGAQHRCPRCCGDTQPARPQQEGPVPTAPSGKKKAQALSDSPAHAPGPGACTGPGRAVATGRRRSGRGKGAYPGTSAAPRPRAALSLRADRCCRSRPLRARTVPRQGSDRHQLDPGAGVGRPQRGRQFVLGGAARGRLQVALGLGQGERGRVRAPPDHGVLGDVAVQPAAPTGGPGERSVAIGWVWPRR
jgi:hypothetical protein